MCADALKVRYRGNTRLTFLFSGNKKAWSSDQALYSSKLFRYLRRLNTSHALTFCCHRDVSRGSTELAEVLAIGELIE